MTLDVSVGGNAVELSSEAVAAGKVGPRTPANPPDALERIESADYGKRPACFRNTLQECLFVLTTTVAVGQYSFYGGAILCITEPIGRDLDMTAAELTWAWAGQNLAGGAFLLFFGRVADLFGRRSLLLSSFVLYTISLLVTGFAINAIYMDVFGGITGLACAASVPPAIGKLGAVYGQPSWRKNRAFACFSAGYPIGFVIGAFVAGVSTQLASWRASFWTLAVMYSIFTMAAWWTVPPDEEQHLGGLDKDTLKQFDVLGAFLTVAGVATFTASLTLVGAAPTGWQISYIIALLVIGVVLIGTCLYWLSIFKFPLMPLRMWKEKNFTLLVITLCAGNSSFSGNLFWISLVWQRIGHTSPLMVAVRLLPAAIGGIVVNVLAGLLMHRVSNKLLMVVASTALVGASALWSAIGHGISYWALSFPGLLLSVIGVDFEFTVTNMYVMSSLPPDQQSVAGGLFNTVVRLVSSVVLAIQTSVYNAAGGTVSGPDSIHYRPYQATFWVSLSGTVIGLCLAPFLTLGTQGGRQKTA